MNVITFDTETTGLLQDPDARIVEIGAVRHNLITGIQVSNFSQLCKPPDSLLDDQKFNLIQRFCGIEKEQVLSAPSYLEVLEDFCRWVGDDLVYAWNLPFDSRMLQRSFFDVMHFHGEYFSRQARNWMQEIRYGGCWQHLYAYMHPDRAGTWQNGQVKTIPLQRAIQYEGIAQTQDHRALSDAHLASQIGNIIHQKLL